MEAQSTEDHPKNDQQQDRERNERELPVGHWLPVGVVNLLHDFGDLETRVFEISADLPPDRRRRLFNLRSQSRLSAVLRLHSGILEQGEVFGNPRMDGFEGFFENNSIHRHNREGGIVRFEKQPMPGRHFRDHPLHIECD
jgi:hypothetical protein